MGYTEKIKKNDNNISKKIERFAMWFGCLIRFDKFYYWMDEKTNGKREEVK